MRILRKSVFSLALLLVLVTSGVVRNDVFGPRSSVGGPSLRATDDGQRTTDQSVLSARVTDAYGKVPLSFEANRGQTDEPVKFVSRGSGYTLFLTPTEAVLRFRLADFGFRIDGRPWSVVRGPWSVVGNNGPRATDNGQFKSAANETGRGQRAAADRRA
jgi:hypothetical protein